ncbi:sentrin-specific protease 1-like [Olea europaea subsp. europaea]|uniref:Sentrin-specific protease 1-like n=1 Tax=Olea europaea subsp. europaea TaxID=158383 RepID=A0A8S0VMX1_OLEEU|nr:sentrin-specific protease 1-like [Olea europaea subsp. europaea]
MAMSYMNGVQYNKPIQPMSSTESRRRTKHRTKKSVEDAGTSGKLVPSVLPLMDSNIGSAHSSDDDDDFVAPLPRRQESSARGKSPVVESPTTAHHSQEEPQSHGAQRDDAFEVLRVQVSELQADKKVLKMVLEDIKSHMSSLNEGKTNKIDDIIQMQACIKSDLMNIRTNVQFLSESVSIMMSSLMNEIIRWSGDRTSEHGVGQKEAPGVGDQEHHGTGGSEKAQEPPSLDLGIEFTPPKVLHSEETQKMVDSIISDVVTATKTVENESPFITGQERGKLFKYDDNIVVFEDYKDNADDVEKSAFMESNPLEVATGHSLPFSSPWADVDYVFMPIIPTNKVHWMLSLLQFRSHTLTVFNSAGKSYCDWKVLQGIEPYVKVLPALMNTMEISKKDFDYHEPEAKELKVIIDNTLPQQTNGHDCGIFVVLYALYLIRGGRCFIPQKFDASKFRMNIVTLLYKYRQVYTKKVNQLTTGEALVIE